MKTVLLFALLFFPALSWAQEVTTAATLPAVVDQATSPVPMAAEPFAKSNVLLVVTTDSARVAWKQIRQTLTEQGYAVAQSDADLLSFSTTAKAPDRHATIALAVTGYVKPTATGSTVYLSGNYTLPVGFTTVEGQAVFAGGEGGANKKAFRAVEKAAKAYPNGKVGYGSR